MIPLALLGSYESIKIIIDPTADINRLAKQGFLDLENTTLDIDSIRVVELIGGDCSQTIEVPCQTYPYRPIYRPQVIETLRWSFMNIQFSLN